jgi:hypothetical protein
MDHFPYAEPSPPMPKRLVWMMFVGSMTFMRGRIAIGCSGRVLPVKLGQRIPPDIEQRTPLPK